MVRQGKSNFTFSLPVVFGRNSLEGDKLMATVEFVVWLLVFLFVCFVLDKTDVHFYFFNNFLLK